MDSRALAITIAIAALGAVLFVVIALIARRGRRADAAATAQTTQLAHATEALARSQGEISGRLQALSESMVASQAALNKTIEGRLDAVSNRMGQSLQASAAKTAEGIGALQTRLTVIDQAQKNITELSSQVVSLQDILTNKQARGAFGQIQLNDLVIAALPPAAYAFEATLSNRRRVDCLIMLPNPPGPIGVDAKFPLEGYQALRAAVDEPAQKAARRAFATDLLKHIGDIADRYILPGETADSALMFLPSEAVYAELHANFQDVLDRSYRAKVWIVSPTTLMATLHTIRAVLKDARMQEQAHLIQREVQLLLQDVGRLRKRTANLEGHFARANEDVREILISADKVVKRGELIEEVQVAEVRAEGQAVLGLSRERAPDRATSAVEDDDQLLPLDDLAVATPPTRAPGVARTDAEARAGAEARRESW